MGSRGLVFKLILVFLALSSIAIAQGALAVVKVDLVNPSTGNPADVDKITATAGSTVTINIRLTSGTDTAAATSNDIGFNTSIFSNPQATIGAAGTAAGKSVISSTPSAGLFRVGVLALSNANVISDGVVAIVTFTVASDAPAGDYTLTNAAGSSDPDGIDLTTTGSTAIITVSLGNPPVVSAGADQTANEGGTVSVSASFTDADTTETHTATINWGDGTTDTKTVTESGGSGTLSGSHTYTDNGTFTVTVTVTDNKSVSGTDTLVVTVSNVAPTVNAGADQTANEGATVTVSASFTDPGLDSHTASINWGDSTTETVVVNATAKTLTGSHTYTDNGTFTVTVTVTDDDSGVGTDTLVVTVSNVAPTVNAGVDQSVNEGATVTLSGTFTDPSTADTHTAQINWGDGTTEAGTVNATARTVAGSHAYKDNGTFTVTVTVTDDNSGVGTDTLVVTVSNVAPEVFANVDNASVNIGVTVNLTASIMDMGRGDTHTATINWGDGSATQTVTVTESQGYGSASGSHSYSSAGSYTITVSVRDDDGATGTGTTTVTVKRVGLNVSKTALTEMGSASKVRPGESITYTLSYVNNGDDTVAGVAITDTVPTNTTFVGANGGGTESGGVVTWSIGSLTGGASGTVSFTVDVSSSVTAGSTIGNTTYSIAGTGVTSSSGTAVNLTVVVPSIAGVTPGHVEQGQTIEVTIQGSNTCFDPLREFGVSIAVAVGEVATVAGSIPIVNDTAQTFVGAFTIPSDAPVGNWVLHMDDPTSSISSCQSLFTTLRVDIHLEPFLVSAQPETGLQGATNLDITIVGVNSNFVQGASTVEFLLGGVADTGITVNSVTAADDDPSTTVDESKTILTANIAIASDATLGSRDIKVTTNPTKGRSVTYPEAVEGKRLFTVKPSATATTASVEIVSPADGAKVSGAAVPISAEVVVANISRVTSVVFKRDSTEFASLTRAPFVASFNADGLTANTSVTITVTVNLTNPTGTATDSITVTPVAAASADVATTEVSGRKRTEVVIVPAVAVEVVTASGQEISLSSQVMSGLSLGVAAAKVQVEERSAADFVGKIDVSARTDLSGVTRQPVGGLDVKFLDAAGTALSSDKTQNVPSKVVLSYLDLNQDGKVDGTDILETTLLMFRDSDGDGDLDQQVSTSDDVDTVANTVTGLVSGFSGIGMLGSPSPGGGVTQQPSGQFCFIATAAYGTPFAYQIDVLRDFRDKILLENPLGKAFVSIYYKLSPGPASYISRHDGLRAATRMALKPVVFGSWMMVERTEATWTVLFLFGGLAGTIVIGSIRRSRKR